MKFIKYNDDKLSKLSLGTVQFGLDYGIANTQGQPSQKDVDNIIQYVYDNDINCFDTAQAYGNSEEVLGKSIHDKKDIFVISKLKSQLFKNDLLENINKSLTNLKINSLYGLLLHDSELLYHWEKEYIAIADSLIEKKIIKYFGVSIYTNEDFELAIENPSIKFIQIPFNIFDQRAISENWFKKAKENNKLIFIRSVFLQGLLLMDIDKVPENLEIAKKYLHMFESYCDRMKISKNELALSFVDTIAKESLILFGCDNLKQAHENIRSFNNLKELDKTIIENIINDFKDMDDKIYNPTKW